MKKMLSFLFLAACLSSLHAQTCTDPVLVLVQAGEECFKYELRMYDPPTDPLSRLSASVQFSGNALGLQAALGPELAAAGGYSLVIDNPPLAPRVNINRTDVSNGFTLPGTAGGWLSLFSFSFAGPPGSTVTAEIDQAL